jgi:hypothetical protein
MSNYKKVEGNSQAVSYFLRRIKRRDLAVIVAAKSYEAFKANPDDEYLRQTLHRNLKRVIYKYDIKESDFVVRTEDNEDSDTSSIKEKPVVKELKKVAQKADEAISDIFSDLEDEISYVEKDKSDSSSTRDQENDEGFDDFYSSKYDKKQPPTLTSDSLMVADSTEEKSKYDKIKSMRVSINGVDQEKDFRLLVFYSYLNEDTCRNAFDRANDDPPKQMDDIDYTQQRKEQKRIKRKGESLGINSIAIIEPTYYVFDGNTSESQVLYIESEHKKSDLEDLLENTGNSLDLQVQMLKPKSLNPSQIEQFNALMKLKEWVNEYYGHKVDSTPSIVAPELSTLEEQLNTRYVAIPEVYNASRGKNVGGKIASMFYIVTIPWAIGGMFTDRELTYFRYWIIDIKTMEIKMINEYNFKGADSPSTLKGCIYSSYSQTKRQKP